MNKPAMAKEDKEYMAESDLRTMIEAEKIKKDKTRYAAAMKVHKEQLAAMEEVTEDMKAIGAKK